MMQLRIVSPEKVVYDGEVQQVIVPGSVGRFEILTGHAPIISSLDEGIVEFATADGEKTQVNILGGFVEVKKHNVSLCVEV